MTYLIFHLNNVERIILLSSTEEGFATLVLGRGSTPPAQLLHRYPMQVLKECTANQGHYVFFALNSAPKFTRYSLSICLIFCRFYPV